jgi:UDP:flavonoid glycosyltransferase YjiC (YdhE family)
MASGARIVITSFGSSGDLNPYIAIAAGLKACGHRPVIATSSYYHREVEDSGLEFSPTRPSFTRAGSVKTLYYRYFNSSFGVMRITKGAKLPILEGNYADLMTAVRDADLLISSPGSFCAPLVAVKTGIPWISTIHTPAYFYSAHDRTVPPLFPPLAHLNGLGTPVRKVARNLLRKATRSLCRPYDVMRQRKGLPPGGHPSFEGLHSPSLVLVLVSPHYVSPQPDWPPNTCITGFPLPDVGKPGASLPPRMEEFLAQGPPPVLFTLGSSAALFPRFFEIGIEAALRLGVRAILLGKDIPARLVPDSVRRKGIALFDYAPYSLVFPRAAVVVHHGGIGTTGLALRSGRPMLVTPQAHDHFDNAARVTRAGVGQSLRLGRFTVARATRKLHTLLSDAATISRAADMGVKLQKEDGVRSACDAIETFLASC